MLANPDIGARAFMWRRRHDNYDQDMDIFWCPLHLQDPMDYLPIYSPWYDFGSSL